MKKLTKIVMYTPTLIEFGGGEKYILLLAEFLSTLPNINVTLISDNRVITKSKLKDFSQTGLENIEYELISGKNELKFITENADIFICLSNYKKVKSGARHHIQLLQIPYGKITGSSILRKLIFGEWREAIKDLYRINLLLFSRNEADLIITNSKFVNDTLQNNYAINSQTLYPPIQDYYVKGIAKKKIILSVGRFFIGLYNEKRYDILTQAFRRAFDTKLNNWEYHIVGNAKNDLKTNFFLSNLKEANKNYPIYFHVNESYESLKRIYNEAAIFWHGAGYGVDEKLYPEKVEHFGMTTVEAMSSGCIPVVINKGGQRESVSTALDGFLWDSIDELINYSNDIAEKKIQVSTLRVNARKKYSEFNFDKFQERALQLISPFFS